MAKLPYLLRSAARLAGYSKLTKGGYCMPLKQLIDKFGRCAPYVNESLSIAGEALEKMKNEVVIKYTPN